MNGKSRFFFVIQQDSKISGKYKYLIIHAHNYLFMTIFNLKHLLGLVSVGESWVEGSGFKFNFARVHHSSMHPIRTEIDKFKEIWPNLHNLLLELWQY